jgi:hypothetical protein
MSSFLLQLGAADVKLIRAAVKESVAPFLVGEKPLVSHDFILVTGGWKSTDIDSELYTIRFHNKGNFPSSSLA